MHGFEAPKRSLYAPVDAEPARKLSYLKLALLTICFLGVQFGWAIQIAFTTPIFLELGVPQVWVSFIWLAGPISGLVVQPLVGAVSDSIHTPFGRRRPFIFCGAIFILLALAMISNATDIGRWFGDSGNSHDAAIVIAVSPMQSHAQCFFDNGNIIGFWILDLSNNTVQGPCRALLVDIAPADQQSLGSSFFSVMLGIGNLIGYFIGHLQLTKYMPFFGTDYLVNKHIHFFVDDNFATAMIVLAICISITVFTTSEPPFIADGPVENPFKKIIHGVRHMPTVVVRVCFVQFFVWVAWFTYMVYITTWVGESIYHGQPNAPEGSDAKNNYDEGVRQGSLALTYNAAVTIGFSAILPSIMHVVGLKPVYFAGNLLFGLCLISTTFIHDIISATVVISLCGIPWAVTMVLPFAIIGQGVDATESGLYMGALNIFVVIPQLIVAVSGGFLIEAFHNITAILVAGGISAIIAAAFVFRLVIASPITEVKDPSINNAVTSNIE